MTRALGAEKAASVLARITPAEAACGIDLLDWLDAADIAQMIEGEHPQIAAVLIAQLDAADRRAGARAAPRGDPARHPPPHRQARARVARGGRHAADHARGSLRQEQRVGPVAAARRHARGGEDSPGRAQGDRAARHAQAVQDRPRDRQADRGGDVRLRQPARDGRQEPRHADPQRRHRHPHPRAQGRRREGAQPLPRLHVRARRRRHPATRWKRADR